MSMSAIDGFVNDEEPPSMVQESRSSVAAEWLAGLGQLGATSDPCTFSLILRLQYRPISSLDPRI